MPISFRFLPTQGGSGLSGFFALSASSTSLSILPTATASSWSSLLPETSTSSPDPRALSMSLHRATASRLMPSSKSLLPGSS